MIFKDDRSCQNIVCATFSSLLCRTGLRSLAVSVPCEFHERSNAQLLLHIKLAACSNAVCPLDPQVAISHGHVEPRHNAMLNPLQSHKAPL